MINIAIYIKIKTASLTEMEEEKKSSSIDNCSYLTNDEIKGAIFQEMQNVPKIEKIVRESDCYRIQDLDLMAQNNLTSDQ